eukprot:scaffold8910_cov102-Cylindrotheca_fusiformis.AAC.1
MVGCAHLTEVQKETIKADFQKAVENLYKHDKESPHLRLKDVFKIIRDWIPSIDMISMFVRWAKKTRYHFGTSSMSTVRVLAKQLGAKTVTSFLNKCRTIKVILLKIPLSLSADRLE